MPDTSLPFDNLEVFSDLERLPEYLPGTISRVGGGPGSDFTIDEFIRVVGFQPVRDTNAIGVRVVRSGDSDRITLAAFQGIGSNSQGNTDPAAISSVKADLVTNPSVSVDAVPTDFYFKRLAQRVTVSTFGDSGPSSCPPPGELPAGHPGSPGQGRLSEHRPSAWQGRLRVG